MKSIELSSSAYQLTLLQTQLYRSVRELMKLNLKQHQLNFTDWFVLAHICRGPMNGYEMTEVSQALSIAMPQLTVISQRLVDRKFIRQKQSVKDARKRTIRCTSAGKTLCETIELDLDAATMEWLSNLSSDQQAAYFSLLRTLENNRPKFVGMKGATVVTVKR